MDHPVPIHLICGFLGSGKTTLLRRILAEQPPEERLVVLVNEFGKLGIDGKLLKGFDSEVMELTSGCICCTLKADFVSSLTKLLKDFKPDRIIVEATGLAEAGDLSRAVEEVAAREDVALGSVATVVDADFFTYREMLGPLYFNQIKAADLLLLNKTDLVPHGDVVSLSKALAEINDRARIMPVVHCAVERDTILAPLPESDRSSPSSAASASPLQEILPDLSREPESEIQNQGRLDDFVSFYFDRPVTINPDCLQRFLADLPWGVFRLKGFVRLPENTALLNYTYRRPELTRVNDNVSGTSLAFVGWKINPDDILAALSVCVMAEE